MRNILYSFFILACFSVAHADIIPNDSHPLQRCVQIEVPQSLSGIILIGKITGPLPPEETLFQITPHTCLEKGYKFNSLSIYWSTGSRYSWTIDESHMLTGNIETLGGNMGWVDERNPLMSETIIYTLQKEWTSEDLTLKQSAYTPIYTTSFGSKIIVHFLWKLAVTLVLEILVLFLVLRIWYTREKISTVRMVIGGVVASGVTLPLFWSVLPFSFGDFWWLLVATCECVIITTEALWYRYFLKISLRDASLASVWANIASIVIGVFL